MIDLRHVQAFVAVVEERSFTKAAERLHIGQSGLSQQIKKLERTIGGELLQRTSRSVDITELGRNLYQPAQDLLAAAAAFEIRCFDRPTKRVLTMAIAENGVNSIAVEALTSVRSSFADVDLEIRRVPLRDQHQAIGHGIECALVRPPFDGHLPSDVETTVVRLDPVVVVVPAGHDAANAESVEAADVETWERIPLSWTPTAWSDHHPLLHDDPAIVPPPLRFEAFREAYATVAISGRPCLMPSSFARTYNVAGAVAVPVSDIAPMPIELAVRTDVDDPLLARLVELLGDRAAEVDRLDELERAEQDSVDDASISWVG